MSWFEANMADERVRILKAQRRELYHRTPSPPPSPTGPQSCGGASCPVESLLLLLPRPNKKPEGSTKRRREASFRLRHASKAGARLSGRETCQRPFCARFCGSL